MFVPQYIFFEHVLNNIVTRDFFFFGTNYKGLQFYAQVWINFGGEGWWGCLDTSLLVLKTLLINTFYKSEYNTIITYSIIRRWADSYY